MPTQHTTDHWKTSPLASDIINHSRAVLANAAHQALVLELQSDYGLSLEQISSQSGVDLERLTSLAAGASCSLSLREYDRLLCLYYFSQAQAPRRHWRDLMNASLSIRAKERRVKRASKRKIKRYYICDDNKIYLTQREHDVAMELLKSKHTYKIMGSKLKLSERTIEFYVLNLRQKLQAANRSELRQKLNALQDKLR